MTITKYEKKFLYHSYGLQSFVTKLIERDKIHSFKTFMNDDSLYPKYWGAEKEYEVFQAGAEIVDVEEFILVLIMSFKNIFDKDGKWGMRREYDFFNLFSHLRDMWSNLPYIYRDCVHQRWLDKHGNLVTPEWLLYFFYHVNLQGSENISIVNLVRNQNRSEYMTYLHECYNLEKNGGLGETRLVYQPVLRTDEGNNVLYLDIEGALYAHLVYRSLKHGVDVAKWDAFELNTRSTVDIQILFLANPKSDYKEITFEQEDYTGMKFHGGVIRMLEHKKKVTFPIYGMQIELNKFRDLLQKSYMSNKRYFDMIEVRDLDFFENEHEIMQKKSKEIEKLEFEKLAMEELDIFSENGKTVEDHGDAVEFDMGINFTEDMGGLWQDVKSDEEKQEEEQEETGEMMEVLEVEGGGGMQIEVDYEENVEMKTNEEEEKKDDAQLFEIGDQVRITSKLADRYRRIANNYTGVIVEIVESPIAKYYGVELHDISMHDKIARCNNKAKKMEKAISRQVIFVTQEHYVQCALTAMKKL